MFQSLKSRSASAEVWGLRFLSLCLTGYVCFTYRHLYLPVFGLTSILPKLMVCGCVSLLSAAALSLVLEKLLDKLGWPSLGRLAVMAFSLINFFLLFDSGERISPTVATKLFLALLTLAGVWLLGWGIDRPQMEKYRGKAVLWVLGIVSLYASLASFGQRFFLDGNTRIHFSMGGLIVCLQGLIWFFPVLLLGLFLLEGLAASVEKQKRPKEGRRKSWWLLFGGLAAVQAVILWILWPGAFPDDAYNQLRAAIGTAPLNDWHPVLVSLIQRLIMVLTGNAAFIVVFQMLFMLWLLTAYLMMGYDYGISLRLLWVLGSVFLLLPNQALSWSNAMKDYPYTLALLWCGYLLLQIVMEKPWIKKLSYYLCLGLSLFLIVGLRHNGIMPFGFVGVLCIYLTIRKFPVLRFRAIAAVCGAAIALAVYKGPVFTALDVVPNIQSTYTSMLCAVGSYINKGLPLSEEAEEIMETVIPLEDWADYYNRYVGHDDYYWGRPWDSVEYDTSQITGGKAFRVYFEALFKAPDVVIKDRLDGMDILWNVSMPEDSFNGNAFHYIFTYDEPLDCIPMEHMVTEDGQRYYKQTAPAQAYYAATNLPTNGALDMLIWRTGAYLIGLMVLLIFWWRNRMNSLYIAAIPLFGNLMASILILYHQSFRYVYFVQVYVAALIFVSILLRKQLRSQHPHNAHLQEVLP